MELKFDLSNEIIDLSQTEFSNDQSWLYKCPTASDVDLNKLLYEDSLLDDFSFITSSSIQEYLRSELQNNIDSRTFTRPKRRSMRPSIEKYNKELYGNDHEPSSPTLSPSKKLTDSGIQSNESPESDTPPKAPVFDLTQSIQSHYFENMLTEMTSMDTFQNMSPPSLVNSMCSSTFTNLMESSFIKNDPVLREIRDTDYTQSILQQETEPMFHSMTESFSSLNSDVPENFLRKVAFDDTFSKSLLKDGNSLNDTTVYFDATFAKNYEESRDDRTFHDVHSLSENKSNTKPILNGTYQRSPKLRTTFNVSDINNGTIKINKTFQKEDESGQKNNTVVISDNQSQVNTTVVLKTSNTPKKRLLSRRDSPLVDSNKANYIADDDNPTDFKRNSLTGSTDSTENLDYMSLSSGSSKSLHKTLSMEGIEKEFYLGQSTPKVENNPLRKIFENAFTHHVSPVTILGDRNSDPELSSNENFEIKPPLRSTGTITKQKSLGNIGVLKEAPRPVSKLQAMRNNIRGSYPNLKTATLPKPSSRTNLNSMGRTLKGSYTSLRPMCANLPVAPPLEAVAQNLPNIEQSTKISQAQFIKPKSSGLPRPVSAATGIPRPMSSKIPAPRSARSIPKPR